MSFKTEAQLTVEINRLTDELNALKEQNGKDFLAEDLGLQTAVRDITKAYEKRDWLTMKNSAAYLMEIQQEQAPEFPNAEKDWQEISNPTFGIQFPTNWNMDRDIVMPRGKFTIFAAEQKTGKTRAMLSQCLFTADANHKVSIMSGEMPTSQIWLLLWLQRQFLDFKNSMGEIEARARMASKDIRWHELRNNYHNFRALYSDKIFVMYTPGWTARRIVYGHKLAENIFGKPAALWATDYAQIIAKEKTAKDMRESQIYNSQLFTVATGIANTAHVLVSQLNKGGDTAESRQYEMDAGMVINFSRKVSEDGQKSNELIINIKHSRSTQSGIFTRWLDAKSGAIVPDATYSPRDSQGRMYD